MLFMRDKGRLCYVVPSHYFVVPHVLDIEEERGSVCSGKPRTCAMFGFVSCSIFFHFPDLSRFRPAAAVIT